jgi:hypothetical protein
MGQQINACKIMVGNLMARGPLGNLGIYGRIVLK